MGIVIGAATSIVSLLVGFFLSRFSQTLDRRSALRTELAGLVAAVVSTTIDRDYTVALSNLRGFLLRNPHLLKKHAVNSRFFDKWLNRAAIEEGKPAGTGWNAATKEALRHEASEMRV